MTKLIGKDQFHCTKRSGETEVEVTEKKTDKQQQQRERESPVSRPCLYIYRERETDRQTDRIPFNLIRINCQPQWRLQDITKTHRGFFFNVRLSAITNSVHNVHLSPALLTLICVCVCRLLSVLTCLNYSQSKRDTAHMNICSLVRNFISRSDMAKEVYRRAELADYIYI